VGELAIAERRSLSRRSIHSLTENGLTLMPVLVEMVWWSAQHDPDTGAPEAFVQEARRDRTA
jgi:hypothetical protein